MKLFSTQPIKINKLFRFPGLVILSCIYSTAAMATDCIRPAAYGSALVSGYGSVQAARGHWDHRDIIVIDTLNSSASATNPAQSDIGNIRISQLDGATAYPQSGGADIYIIPTSDLITKVIHYPNLGELDNIDESSIQSSQEGLSNPYSANNGAVPPIYLLPGSEYSYRMCISVAEQSQTEPSTSAMQLFLYPQQHKAEYLAYVFSLSQQNSDSTGTGSSAAGGGATGGGATGSSAAGGGATGGGATGGGATGGGATGGGATGGDTTGSGSAGSGSSPQPAPDTFLQLLTAQTTINGFNEQLGYDDGSVYCDSLPTGYYQQRYGSYPINSAGLYTASGYNSGAWFNYTTHYSVKAVVYDPTILDGRRPWCSVSSTHDCQLNLDHISGNLTILAQVKPNPGIGDTVTSGFCRVAPVSWNRRLYK